MTEHSRVEPWIVAVTWILGGSPGLLYFRPLLNRFCRIWCKSVADTMNLGSGPVSDDRRTILDLRAQDLKHPPQNFVKGFFLKDRLALIGMGINEQVRYERLCIDVAAVLIVPSISAASSARPIAVFLKRRSVKTMTARRGS